MESCQEKNEIIFATKIILYIEQISRHRNSVRTEFKRLKGIQDPDYRLRLGDYRVFYNVDDTDKRVDVLRVLHKDQTRKYYKEMQK